MISIRATDIPDVRIIDMKRFGDNRGWFAETYNRAEWAAAGIDVDFIMDAQSYSAVAGTLRGMHFQRSPKTQTKLVRASRGAVFDVAVDIRLGSPWYGRWVGAELSAANGLALLIPRGFAHGFVTLEPDTELLYRMDSYYAPEYEAGIAWNDPDLGIFWPIAPGGVVIAERDRDFPRLAEMPTCFTY